VASSCTCHPRWYVPGTQSRSVAASKYQNKDECPTQGKVCIARGPLSIRKSGSTSECVVSRPSVPACREIQPHRLTWDTLDRMFYENWKRRAAARAPGSGDQRRLFVWER